MQGYPFIILGGGVAAGYAAKIMAENPKYKQRDLAIISAEDALPYDRPPLSKDFLDEEVNSQDIRINSPDFYRENGIDVFLNTVITSIDPQEKMLYTNHGDGFAYDRLLLATGSKVNKIGVPGEDLENVLYLRRIGQSKEIRQTMRDAKKVVVVGGGYIGMEVAAILADNEADVTMIYPHKSLMGHRFFNEELSRFFEDYFKERGVTLMPETEVKEFIGESGRVTTVNTVQKGDLEADLVVLGTGVEPNTELAENIRIIRADDGGYEVDENLQTTIEDIYAAGDAANFPDVIFGKRRRIDHWHNAKAQGEYWARLMLGETDEPFKAVPYFFSDIFDLSYEVWGDTEEAEDIITRGSMDDADFSLWWVKDERVMAAFVMSSRPDEERTMAQEWIESGEPVNLDVLRDASEPIYKGVNP